MARSRTIDDDLLLDRITEVFRAGGFDGALLGDLETASGLRRASLYHRFPGGKEQMAEAVLTRIGSHFTAALEPMRTDPDIAAGIAESARRIQEFYGGGLLSCAVDTLTLGGAPVGVRAGAATLARAWIEAMTDASIRGGQPADEAARRAREAFARAEGGLVLARVLGDTSVFEAVLAELPVLLLGPDRGAATTDAHAPAATA